MNINKLTKLFLPALMVAASTLFITGCDLFDNDDDPVFVAPPAPPAPTEGITGIWTGTFTRKDVTGTEPETYVVGMSFYMPAGLTRGDSIGSAFRTFPEAYPATTDVSPHFLFEGGYEEISGDTNQDGDLVCNGWGVGRFGTNASFLREFSYETGSQAGPDQRGAMCLALSGNKLTGDFKTENYGSFLVDLTYSAESTRDTSVVDLTSGGIDTEEYQLWTNDNSGDSMSFSQDTLANDSIDVTVDGINTGTCGSTVRITEIPGYNLFTVETLDPHVTGCEIQTPGPTTGFETVNLPYRGMGSLVSIDGTNVFVPLMASFNNEDSAQVLYNHFTIQ